SRVVRVDVTVPLDWKKDPNKVLLFQAHQDGPGSGPPIQVFVWNESLYCRVTNAAGYVDVWKGALVRGVKMSFVVGVKWGALGRYVVWKDGVLLGEKTVSMMGYLDSPLKWCGIGLYWPGATETPETYVGVDWRHSAIYSRWIIADAGEAGLDETMRAVAGA